MVALELQLPSPRPSAILPSHLFRQSCKETSASKNLTLETREIHVQRWALLNGKAGRRPRVTWVVSINASCFLLGSSAFVHLASSYEIQERYGLKGEWIVDVGNQNSILKSSTAAKPGTDRRLYKMYISAFVRLAFAFQSNTHAFTSSGSLGSASKEGFLGKVAVRTS